MKLLLVSATEFEIMPLLTYLNTNFKNKENRRFFSKEIDIHILVAGVGPIHTTFALATVLAQHQFDLVLNLGIAGAFNRALAIGQVLQVINDRFADVGVEEANGAFTDLFELQLVDWNEAPYINGKLYAPNTENKFLPQATAITVNKVHGSAESIQKIEAKYPADLESMEGAAVFYACLQHQIDCLQIRSISNYVEPRNKDNWDIPLAIDNLNKVAIELIETLSSPNTNQ
ncbi:futalosine hydrolase [Aureispira anguillae]|uniref:Futalosine hydrolase n=1 Tax=Aureispira anguillae TaxID=2864201 RepID=A0A915YBR8_9BACT|nr:futalosine hydrolase [Aureispira anguillae]BDS10169.1 futalosine hydrolase [Aureispira anguillae]